MKQLWRRLPFLLVTLPLVFFSAAGMFGGGSVDERFDAKTIVLERAGETGLQVVEIVDIDFGTNERRGYRRTLRTDLGFPEDVVARSDTMPDDLFVGGGPGEAELRIGNPDITGTGRHRYLLAYILPEAFDGDRLDYSVIDPGEELETGRFQIILDGFRLEGSLCSVGSFGDVGGCRLEEETFGQSVVIEPLAAGDGINLSGVAEPVDAPFWDDLEPPLGSREDPATWWRALLVGVVGLGIGELVVAWSRRRGANEVGVGGASGAAFWQPGSPTERLGDDRLAQLATIEFAPPGDIAPWEGRILVRETLPDDAPSHWFTSMIAAGAITLTETDNGVTLSPAIEPERLSPADRSLFSAVFPGGRPRSITKSYDVGFAGVWKQIREAQRSRIEERGWWTGKVIGASLRNIRVGSLFLAVFVAFGLVVAIGAAGDQSSNPFDILPLALAITAVASALPTWLITRPERASRTAAGSAAYLRTESFRRFLHASEGRHVEEAHERGVLREYTGWAVALGEAEAWKRAAATLGSAAVVAAVASTMYFHDHGRLFSTATTKPSSGDSGRGGFGGGGGGVGGGGGGGSSGSW